MTNSADLPVRPFGAEPAAPALAPGAPPMLQARRRQELLRAPAALLLLCATVPAAAAPCIVKTAHHSCTQNMRQAVNAAPAKKPAAGSTVAVKSSGGFSGWPRIAADLMP